MTFRGLVPTLLAFSIALLSGTSGAEARRAGVIEAIVPVEKIATDRAHIALYDRLRDVRRGQRLKLDLAFDLDAAPDSGATILRRDIRFGADGGGRLEEVPCLTDEVYDLDYTGAHSFVLRLFENSETIRLRVYPGDKASFPENDVSCVHDVSAPGGKRLRILGTYIAMPTATPQGRVLQLRPAPR